MQWRALVIAASVAWLAGCGAGSQPPITGTGAATPDRGASWMASSAATAKRLLYVSDPGTFDVFVYTFPDLKPMGKLTGFEQPQGECSDRNGNVWITNSGALQILEFAHGGKKAIRALADPTGYPGACAVDARTGDLAVANIFNESGAGEVLIYRGGTGTPTPYFNPAVTYYYFDGYDPAGNLYVSGTTSSGAYVLSILKHGKRGMESLSVRGGTIHFPGTVQWSGARLVLGDQKCDGKKGACFYEASVSGATAKLTRETRLAGSCDIAQAWIQDGRLAAGNYDDCGRSHNGAYLWTYPGGLAIRHVTGVMRPVGTTISSR